MYSSFLNKLKEYNGGFIIRNLFFKVQYDTYHYHTSTSIIVQQGQGETSLFFFSNTPPQVLEACQHQSAQQRTPGYARSETTVRYMVLYGNKEQGGILY